MLSLSAAPAIHPRSQRHNRNNFLSHTVPHKNNPAIVAWSPSKAREYAMRCLKQDPISLIEKMHLLILILRAHTRRYPEGYLQREK